MGRRDRRAGRVGGRDWLCLILFLASQVTRAACSKMFTGKNHAMKNKNVLMLIGVIVSGLAGCNSGPSPLTKPETKATTPLVWQVVPGQSSYYINSVAISADGSRTIGGTFFHSYGGGAPADTATNATATGPSQSGTFGTYCYDRTGRQLWKDEFVGWQGVYWVDLAANGAYAASGGWFSQNPYAGFVRAFDAATGQRLLDYPTQRRVNQVALSGDGTWLISAAESMVLFQLVSGSYQKVAEFPALPVSTGSNYFVTAGLSADGGTIVCADYAGNVLLLQSTSHHLALIKQWALPSGSSHMVRLAPDGKTFVAGGSSGSFYLFDTAQFISTGQPTITYQTGVSGSVYSVAVADDGSSFVGVVNANASQGTVYYVGRNGAQGTLLWQYSTAHNPNCVWLNIAHGLLAVADGHPDGTPGAFYLLNTATGTLRWQYPTTDMSWPIMISADGSGVVAGSDDSHMYYFTP